MRARVLWSQEEQAKPAKVLKHVRMEDGRLIIQEPLTASDKKAIQQAISGAIEEACWMAKQEQRAKEYQEMIKEREAGGSTKSARYIIPGFAVKVVRERE